VYNIRIEAHDDIVAAGISSLWSFLFVVVWLVDVLG
jgi:hypothetical protein